jgi:hypothetical protein
MGGSDIGRVRTRRVSHLLICRLIPALTPFRHSEPVEGALASLARLFIGWPTDNIADIWEHAYRSRFYRGGEVVMSAISGLDIALWDLKVGLRAILSLKTY